MLRLWQGRFDDAAHAAHQALDGIADPGFAPWLVDFSIVYATAARVDAESAEDARARGDADAAAEAEAAAAWAVARCDEMLARIPEGLVAPRGLACRSLAVAEAARAAGRAGPDVWVDAVERFRALGELYLVAYAEFRPAEAAVAAGSRSGAAAEVPLRDAHALTVGMGEVPLRAQIEALAQRSRISLGDDGQALADHDTLAKLDARNRGEAAAIAHRLGLTGDSAGVGDLRGA